MSDCFDHYADYVDSMISHSMYGDGDDYGGRRYYKKRERLPNKCKFCNAEYLKWFNRNGKWRLYDKEGNAHSCNMQIHTKNLK